MSQKRVGNVKQEVCLAPVLVPQTAERGSSLLTGGRACPYVLMRRKNAKTPFKVCLYIIHFSCYYSALTAAWRAGITRKKKIPELRKKAWCLCHSPGLYLGVVEGMPAGCVNQFRARLVPREAPRQETEERKERPFSAFIVY